MNFVEFCPKLLEKGANICNNAVNLGLEGGSVFTLHDHRFGQLPKTVVPDAAGPHASRWGGGRVF